MKKKSLNSDCY